MSVRPYRGSFEPIGMAHPMTSHIEPLAAQARPVCSRGHRVKHDSRMLGPATAPGLSVRYGPQGLSLAAKLGLVPLSLGGVLGHPIRPAAMSALMSSSNERCPLRTAGRAPQQRCTCAARSRR